MVILCYTLGQNGLNHLPQLSKQRSTNIRWNNWRGPRMGLGPVPFGRWLPPTNVGICKSSFTWLLLLWLGLDVAPAFAAAIMLAAVGEDGSSLLLLWLSNLCSGVVSQTLPGRIPLIVTSPRGIYLRDDSKGAQFMGLLHLDTARVVILSAYRDAHTNIWIILGSVFRFRYFRSGFNELMDAPFYGALR